MGAKGGGEASTAGWELFRLSDKRSGHLCAAVDELRRFDRRTPILVRQYTRLRTGDAPGTSCVTAQNCDGACADSPRCVRRPPSRGSVRRRELRHDPVARAKLAPSRTRSAGCPPKTAERQMRSLSGQSTCAALAGVSLRMHRRRLSDAGGRTADGVPSSVQRFGGGGGGDGGQAAAGSAVAAQIVTRSRGVKIVARVCRWIGMFCAVFIVLTRVTGTGYKSVDCVSFIAT